MKTFDIALIHLAGYDFSKFDLSKPVPDEDLFLQRCAANYVHDEDNTTSNMHYRGVVFTVALYHLAEKKQRGESTFYSACEIIKTYKKCNSPAYKNTIYPNLMVHHFNIFCETTIDANGSYCKSNLDLRFNTFCTAYHYLID